LKGKKQLTNVFAKWVIGVMGINDWCKDV